MAEEIPSIFVISGGVGASGEQLVHTVLAQYPDRQLRVVIVGNVRHPQQIENAVRRAAACGGILVHTLVQRSLRDLLVRLAKDSKVPAIDLMGPLLSNLTEKLAQEPVGHPGQYRQLHRDYFERVASIEFTMAHDDGKNPQGWPLAEIVLVGVSRVGKTPLSMYLSVLGWKVANVPLVTEITPRPELFQLDRRRVIALTMEPGQLLSHRQQRQHRLGLGTASPYADPQAIHEEVEAARLIYQKGGFSMIDVTDKAIEASAEDVIGLITRRFGASEIEKHAP